MPVHDMQNPCHVLQRVCKQDTSLTEQGAAEVAGMSLCKVSPTVAMPRVPREAGSWQPLKYSLLVVSPAQCRPSVPSVT